MQKCSGVKGWLLGHSYKPVFDTDIEKYSVEESYQLIQMATQHNFWNFDYSHQSDIKPDFVKRTTKVYVGHVCTRCGNKIKDKTMIV